MYFFIFQHCPEKVEGVPSFSGGGRYEKTKEGNVIVIQSAVRIRNKYFFDDDGVRHESQGLDSVPRGCYTRAGLQFNTNSESNAPVAYPVLNSLCKRTCVAENDQMDGSDQPGDASGDTSNEDTSSDENEDGTSINGEKSGTKNGGIDAGTSGVNSGGLTNGANNSTNSKSDSSKNAAGIVIGVLCGLCVLVGIVIAVVQYQKKQKGTESNKPAVAAKVVVVEIEMNDTIEQTNTSPELPTRSNETKKRQQLDQFNKIHKGTHVGGHQHKKKKGHHNKAATKVVEIETDTISKMNTTPDLPSRPASHSISLVL